MTSTSEGAPQPAFSDFDRWAMQRALELAARGLETTDPNPRVGCVIARGEEVVGRRLARARRRGARRGRSAHRRGRSRRGRDAST